jgi:long-chain acyl-CoA synthetase
MQQPFSNPFITKLIASKVRSVALSLRPNQVLEPEEGWNGETRLRGGGLELDSLERIQVASAISEMFHVHEFGLEDLLLTARKIGDVSALVLKCLGEDSQTLTFRSSGSMGSSKATKHSLDDLLEEAAFFCTVLPGRKRILCGAPIHHLYGFLFGGLLSELLEVESLDVSTWSAARLVSELRPGDLLVTHPTQWKMAANTATDLQYGVVGVSSGGPIDEKVWTQLHKQGLTMLMDVYGSTETSGIGFRFHAKAPFEFLPKWKRNLEMPEGRMRTEAILPDRMEWTGHEHAYLKGRKDSVVQIAGVNVDLSTIAERLNSHPAVQDCVILPLELMEGNRLKAIVTLQPGVEADEAVQQSLWKWIDDNLTGVERPKQINFAGALERNEMGKVLLWPKND